MSSGFWLMNEYGGYGMISPPDRQLAIRGARRTWPGWYVGQAAIRRDIARSDRRVEMSVVALHVVREGQYPPQRKK